MEPKITKKRKLEDGSAVDCAIDVEEHDYVPIRLKSLQQNLQDIPHELVRKFHY